MKNYKRILAMLMSAALILTSTPLSPQAAEPGGPEYVANAPEIYEPDETEMAPSVEEDAEVVEFAEAEEPAEVVEEPAADVEQTDPKSQQSDLSVSDPAKNEKAEEIVGTPDFDSAVDIVSDSVVPVNLNYTQSELVFKFVPEETGTYYIVALPGSDPCDPVGALYDSEGEESLYFDDSDKDLYFDEPVNLEGGKTYYISAGSYSGDEGDYKLVIRKAISIDVEYDADTVNSYTTRPATTVGEFISKNTLSRITWYVDGRAVCFGGVSLDGVKLDNSYVLHDGDALSIIWVEPVKVTFVATDPDHIKFYDPDEYAYTADSSYIEIGKGISLSNLDDGPNFIISDDNYVFDQYELDGVFYSSLSEIDVIVDSDITITVHLKDRYQDVNFHLEHGEFANYATDAGENSKLKKIKWDTQQYFYIDDGDLTIASMDEGYRLVGWSETYGGSEIVDFDDLSRKDVLSDYYAVYDSVEMITLDTPKTVEFPDLDNSHYYMFIPDEDGSYAITRINLDVYPDFVLYDVSMNHIKEGYGELCVSLEKGQVYYIYASDSYYEDEPYSYDFLVSRALSVTLNANGGTFTDGSDVSKGSYAPGNNLYELIYDKPSREGMIFAGWSYTADGEAESDYSEIEEGTTYYAVWEKAYTITYHGTDGSLGELDEGDNTYREKNIEKGTSFIDLLDVKNYLEDYPEGKTFAGWSLTADGAGIISEYSYKITDDIDLYAVWGEPVEITFASSMPEKLDYYGTDTYTITAARGSLIKNLYVPDYYIADDTYYVSGYEVNGISYNKWSDIEEKVSDDMTITLVVSRKIKITFEYDTAHVFKEYEYEEDHLWGLRGESLHDYHINLYTDDTCYISGYTINGETYDSWWAVDLILTEDITVKVETESKIPVNFHVKDASFSDKNNGYVDSQLITRYYYPDGYFYDAQFTPFLNDIPEGKCFAGWSSQGYDGEINVGYCNTDDAPRDCYAVFANAISLTFDYNGNTFDYPDITMSTATVPEGSLLKDHVPYDWFRKDDVYLAGWSDRRDGDTLDLSKTVVNADATYYAVWKPFIHVTLHSNGSKYGMEEKTRDVKVEPNVVLYRYISDPSGYFDTPQNLRAAGWALTPDAEVSVDDRRLEFEDGMDLYAVWGTPLKVTYDANGRDLFYDEASSYVMTYAQNQRLEIWDYYIGERVDSGDVLVGWSLDKDAVHPDDENLGNLFLTEDITLYGVYGHTNKARFHIEDKDLEDCYLHGDVEAKVYERDQVANQPMSDLATFQAETKNSNKKFDYWYIIEDGKEVKIDLATYVMPSEDAEGHENGVDIYARFEDVYQVILNANGGYFATESETVFKALAVAGEPILHLPSDTVTSLDPIKVFDQWYYDSDCTEPLGAALSEFVPTGDVTLYAGYEKIKINVADCEVSLTPQRYVYDGRKKEPKVTVSYEGETLNAQTDYTVTYKNNSNAGKGKVTIVGTGDYEGETTLEFTIGKADAVLNFAEKSVSKKTTDAAFVNALTKTTDGKVTYKSEKTSVATVDSSTGKVTIKGVGTTTITATAAEGTNYKAGSASFNLTVTKAAASGFTDVQDPKNPYYKAIYWAAEKGITKGYADGSFGINEGCTRGAAMMFLWRVMGKPAPKNVSKSPFKDVSKTHAYYNAILWGSQKGITKGYSDGTFGINRVCTRGDIMMFIWRAKGKPTPKTVSKSPFKDVPQSHVYYKAILWGSQAKITTGYTSGVKKGTFGVNEQCTRGQIVTFLYRMKN